MISIQICMIVKPTGRKRGNKTHFRAWGKLTKTFRIHEKVEGVCQTYSSPKVFWPWLHNVKPYNNLPCWYWFFVCLFICAPSHVNGWEKLEMDGMYNSYFTKTHFCTIYLFVKWMFVICVQFIQYTIENWCVFGIVIAFAIAVNKKGLRKTLVV